MPDAAATNDVDATVVAPQVPDAITTARSRTLALTMLGSVATRSSAASSRPIRIRPSRTAIVAGTAPDARTADSMSRAVAALLSDGRPWLMIVDSRATTAAARRQRGRDLRIDVDK